MEEEMNQLLKLNPLRKLYTSKNETIHQEYQTQKRYSE